MMTDDWIDVSVPLRTGMVHWPGNPPVVIERTQDIGLGDVANVSKLSMGAHTGTHMDAPLHFIHKGKGIHTMPLSVGIGQARVIEMHDPESIKPEELRPYQIQRGERVLFKTRNSPRCWQTDDFVEDFVYISQEAARYLAAQQVQLVGIDYLSVGGFTKDGVETHHALLEAGIWLIEGLNLTNIAPGIYELICLPLRIEDADGAPARAILRPAESTAK
jgi:arylformamidase